MVPVLALTVNLAEAGHAQRYLGDGWALPEPRFTWALGAESRLRIPIGSDASDYVLTLDVVPFIHEPDLPAQRLIVSVNGAVLGSSAITRPALLAYAIPDSIAGASGVLDIRLQHPDFARPTELGVSGDHRMLTIALTEARLYRADPSPNDARRATRGLMLNGSDRPGFEVPRPRDAVSWLADRTGLDPTALAFRFESIGENCEFGLFQRRCGAEPLGLLRFSSIFPRPLARGIETGFAGLGDPADLDPRLEGDGRREFMIHERVYGLAYHSFVYEGQRTPDQMREQEAVRLKFLRRKFIEDQARAEKIFVYKCNDGISEAEILALYLALRRHAEHTLLWVVPPERDRPAGTVEVVMPGLLKAYIDRFAPQVNAYDLSFDGWLLVCGNALALVDAMGARR